MLGLKKGESAAYIIKCAASLSEVPVSEEADFGRNEVHVSEEAYVSRTEEHVVEHVIVKEVIDGSSEEDVKQGIDQDVVEAHSDKQVDYDVKGINNKENEIVEPDVDVHLFGISKDVPFNNIGVTNLVPDDILEGDDVDVVNPDGFDSDTSNDNETSNYKRRMQKFSSAKEANDRVYLHSIKSKRMLKLYNNDNIRVRARCEGKVSVFTMSQGTGPTRLNQGMGVRPSISGRAKSDLLVNNICEVFNGKIVGGRPKKKRKRSKNKDEPFVKDGKVSKKGRTITCPSCGNIRHNKATCTGQGLSVAGGQDGSGGAGVVVGITTPTIDPPIIHEDTSLIPTETPTISLITSTIPPTAPTTHYTSLFIHTDSSDDDTPDTPSSPTHEIPPVKVVSPTSQILPAPFGRVGPLPTHRLTMRHSVDYSSSDHFTSDDSLRDSPSDSSSETLSDSSLDALSDSSSSHSYSDHSSPALPPVHDSWA
uniref:Zinc finger, SWIM-type n=1 Tax=Tanacetum cinerariifolium TaxID=118510 RepID=A0A6L2M063_TANCI|nr:zinc finger, SWIM-type [Tanacetum cinerariifolium]